MYCPECNRIGRLNRFCDVCGGKTMKSEFPCPHSPCNGTNFLTMGFCSDCGKPIQEAAGIFINKDNKSKEGGELKNT